MSTKLKALGLGLVAMLAMSAFAVVNAGAETGGHFTSGASATILTGTEGGEPESEHTTELVVEGLTPITCTDSTYEGTMGSTETSITVTPDYTECGTTNGDWDQVHVDMNGCDYEFRIGAEATGDNTVDLVCPPEKSVDIEHTGSCTIEITPFNGSDAGITGGVAYHTIELNNKHAITLESTVSGFEVKFESGFCVLLGTKQEGELTGSVTVEGFEEEGGAEGPAVDITAVGSEEM